MKPIGKIKLKVNSRGGSFNANQFVKKDIEPKAIYEDLTLDTSFMSEDFKDKQSTLSFAMLKEIAKRVAPVSAIIHTRIDQVGAFTGRARYSNKNVGFRVKLREQDEELTEEQEKKLKYIEDLIYNCGTDVDKTRDSFDTFIRKCVRDSLVCDQVNFEITRDSNGKIAAFYIVDPETIKPVAEDYKPTDDILETIDDEDNISYVQVIDNKIVAAFTDDEMAFAVRNPSSDVRTQPFGTSEIEALVRQLTSFLEAEDYNMKFFKQGGMTKGILNLKQEPGSIGDRHALESFKRQWRTQVTGLNGAWKIPVFQLPGALEFINIAQSGGEMVFEKWTNYLINIACAVYRIDPAEINFPNNGGAGGKGSSLFNSSEEKYNQSKDKGLYPLMQFIENTINKYIVSEFGEEYVFVFEGMDEKSEESKLDNDKKKSESIMTINEVRAERGLEPLECGDIIANAYFMQAYQGGSKSQDDGFETEDLDYDGYEDVDVEEDEEDEEMGEFKKSILTIEEIDLNKSIDKSKLVPKKVQMRTKTGKTVTTTRYVKPSEVKQSNFNKRDNEAVENTTSKQKANNTRELEATSNKTNKQVDTVESLQTKNNEDNKNKSVSKNEDKGYNEYELKNQIKKLILNTKTDTSCADGYDSLKRHTDKDGNLTSEREELHRKIILKHFENLFPVKGQATFVIMGGGTASGKSTVINSGLLKLPEQSVKIDSDNIKSMLPEYKEMLNNGDNEAAGYTHEESSALGKRIQKIALTLNYNTVLDDTGDGPEHSLRSKIENGKSKGYKVIGEYVTVPTDVAIERSIERGIETGRKVSIKKIKELHKNVSIRAMQFAEQFDEIRLYDNSDKPVKIAEGGNGNKLTPIKGYENKFKKFKEKRYE